MPEDFGSYLDPGVYVDEIPSPVVASVGITPTVVALIGDTQRYRTYTEVRQLLSDTPVTLAKMGVNTDTIEVKSRYTGRIYDVDDDYDLVTTSGQDGVSDTLDDVTTIARDPAGNITAGDYVTINYQYTDPTYYDPVHYVDYNDVRDAYGDPFDGSTGVINSELTLAAFLAFSNGAREVVAVPVQAVSSTPNTSEWTTAIDRLRDVPRANVVVPLTGSVDVHDAVRNHVVLMENLSDYRRAFIGRAVDVTLDDVKSQAVGYAHSRIVVVGPSLYKFYEGDSNTFVDLPGYYAAAAVAGVHASRPVQVPITRKRVNGIYAIPTQSSEAVMVDAQRSGVCLLWQKRDGSIIVRHGVTTNMTDIYSREISIQAAKDRIQALLADTLDAQQLIGSVITSVTPEFVVGAVVTALESAVESQLIFGYSKVQSRQPISNPTLLQIRFMYKPTLPLNYVQVEFALDTSTGSLEFK